MTITYLYVLLCSYSLDFSCDMWWFIYADMVVNLGKAHREMHTHTGLLIKTACIFRFMGKKIYFSILLFHEVYIGILCFQRLMVTLFRRPINKILLKIGITTISKPVYLSTSILK